MKYGYCTIFVAKTKELISCRVTAQLLCAFVFAYAKHRFSHDEAQLPVEQIMRIFNYDYEVTLLISPWHPVGEFWWTLAITKTCPCNIQRFFSAVKMKNIR